MAKREQNSLPGAISASLMKMGMDLEERGLVHQALTAYMKIIEQYPDSRDVTAATDRIMAIADLLRKKRQYHVAMMVVDRLQAVYPTR